MHLPAPLTARFQPQILSVAPLSSPPQIFHPSLKNKDVKMGSHLIKYIWSMPSRGRKHYSWLMYLISSFHPIPGTLYWISSHPEDFILTLRQIFKRHSPTSPIKLRLGWAMGHDNAQVSVCSPQPWTMYLTLLTCVGSPRCRVRVPLCSRAIQEVNIMEMIQCPPKTKERLLKSATKSPMQRGK